MELKAAAELHQGRAVALGQAATAEPLLAAGFQTGTLHIDTRQLSAMRSFMTGRMENVAARAVTKINDQMGLVMTGAQSQTDAINHISILLQGDRGRALTIMRTEVGRAYSVAAQESMEVSSQINKAMQKQWHKSGKMYGRSSHIKAHLQLRAVNEPFEVGGEKLMYPRDPKASIENTINCGCDMRSFMASWETPPKP
ncbi:hypothetical protein [Desulfovibrio sp.]|uniref:hypothetical protein n=1 Tax=Desulfovibrio sp. TaxID=885 RepID=UPI0026191C3E|nr:hypothetical protein [Desulfovibrio sp.]